MSVWDELCGSLAAVLDSADGLMLESLVVAVIEARSAEASVLERGLILDVERVGRDGASFVVPMENPAASTARKARAEIRQLCDRMGIGPSSRARLAGLSVQGRDPMADVDGLADVVELRAVSE